MIDYRTTDDFGSLIEAINHCTLEIHRAAREASFSGFPVIALKLIGEVVSFDSAWWGYAAEDSSLIHQEYLYNCDDSILEAYLPYAGWNFFRKAMKEKPGVTINLADIVARKDFVVSRIYQEFCKHYQQEWLLGTLLIEPVSQLCEKLIIWRHDCEKPFNELERRAKQLIMPHLEEAHRVSRMRNVFGGMPKTHVDWAVIDGHGYLREISPGFVHFLRLHCPDWAGSRVPQAVMDHIAGSFLHKPFNRLQALPRGEFHFLQLQSATALDDLTEREVDVISRYALGKTYSEIAKELAISPATARNHISRCYKKLSVNNKAELLMRLNTNKTD